MKALIVGNGPSKSNIDFIKNFDGIIVSTDRSVEHLLEHNIMPDYIGYLETRESKDQEWVVSFMPKITKDVQIVYKNEEALILKAGAVKHHIHLIAFAPPSYVNNVGLFCLVFVQRNIRPDEVHLIGLEHKGHEYEYAEYQDWLQSFKKYVWTEPDSKQSKIIDHSNGEIEKWLSTLQH